jgi:hypothetical protein
VDVIVNRQELSIPPTISAAPALGFGLDLAKGVLSGRGDEVLDLVKTNLFRQVRVTPHGQKSGQALISVNSTGGGKFINITLTVMNMNVKK